MNKDLAVYLLEKAQKKGADDVVVQVVKSKKSQSKFANSKISAVKTWDSNDIVLFLAKDKKVLMTSLKKFTKSDAIALLNRSFNFLKKIQPSESYRGLAKGPFSYSKHEEYDQSIEGMNGNVIVKEGIEICKENKVRRTAGVFEDTVGENYLLTSNNVEAYERGTSVYYSVRALADKNSSGHTVAVSRNLSKLDFRDAARRACDIAKQSLGAKKRISGKFDVLFEPLAWANVLNTVGESASIFSVEAGLSFLEGQEGKKVGNDNVTLMDDATIKNSFGYSIFDSEGVPTQNNLLIDKGILKGFLHNTSSAERYNVKTTANAGLISPDPHALMMKEGKYSKDNMFAGIKNGIWITNVWYTRFQNYSTGDFSTIPRDGIFLIENGKIVRPLKEIRVTDNVLQLMKNVTQVGKDQEQIYSWESGIPTFTPPVIVKDVNITTH